MDALHEFARGRTLASAILVALVACTASIEPGLVAPTPTTGDDAESARARAAFDRDVGPLLAAACASCHSAPSVAPAFLLPNPDVRTTLLTWPSLVELDAPDDSALLRKGSHDGPAWSAQQSQNVRAWIDLEAVAAGASVRDPGDERPDDGPAVQDRTEVIDLVEGPVDVALDAIGLPGSVLSFRVDLLAAGVYLTDLSVTAGPAGAHLVGPLFVPWMDGAPRLDLAQPLDDVDVLIEAGATASLGGGALVLPNVPRGAALSVELDVAETLEALPDPGDQALGPCTAVRAFTEHAQPQLDERCARCHGGDDEDATNAVDMTRLSDLSVDAQTFSCVQISSRVRMEEPAASPLLSVVDPGSDSLHPYRFAGNAGDFATFRQALIAWLEAAAQPEEN